MLGAAIKAVVESVSALDGENHRCSAEKKFSLLYRMARYGSYVSRRMLFTKTTAFFILFSSVFQDKFRAGAGGQGRKEALESEKIMFR